jgi:beta-glucosidase
VYWTAASCTIADLGNHFLWASGVEDTFVVQARAGHRSLDEYELMGHYQHWKEDLALTRELGVKALRWGVPWYRVEPQNGVFDWSWTDEVIPYLVEDLDITPIIDLVHYGCPLWLHREFANPDYPEHVARYAAAFAERYRGLVRWYTPLNEPIMTALMCGRRGVWPPFLRGEAGYARLMTQIARGVQESVLRMKEIDPTAVMVHVEATGLTRAAHPFHALLAHEQAQHFLALDLVSGRVTPEHELFPWLVRNGVSWGDLERAVNRRVDLDVIGLNFYPQWSTHALVANRKGRFAYRRVEQDGSGFGEMIQGYFGRYRVPVMITETSAFGSPQIREAWLRDSFEAVNLLRSHGVPIIGYTWFPMFTMIDWRYRFGRRPVEDYRVELGLYTLNDRGGARWQQTPLVPHFQELVAGSELPTIPPAFNDLEPVA